MSLSNLFFIVSACVLITALSILQIARCGQISKIIEKTQIVILLIFSYCFLGFIDWNFPVCIVSVSLITYILGILIETTREKDRIAVSKCLTVFGCIILTTNLILFKYTNYIIQNFNKAFVNCIAFKIFVPAGISFFTFSALSYLIDIYRGTCKAEKNIIDFCLYMVFFPKIIAGPIVRYTDFYPQLKNYMGITRENLSCGAQIFVFGLFKKMVLADHLGVFVDDVFRVPNAFDTGTVILSALSYSMQIYLDFSGYSDMAIGLAKAVGFDFKPNFNLPYCARNFSDFWSRWHISLSQWFRDYLYIPLGGSRKGTKRTCFNLIFVMLVSGVWHGAGWNFVLWGLFNGIACCVTRQIKRIDEKLSNCIFLRLLEVSITFIFTTLFWTIFRIDNIGGLINYWKALFTIHSGIFQPYSWTFFSMLCVVCSTVIASIKSRQRGGEKGTNGFYPILDLSKTWALIVFFTFCGFTILLGYSGNNAFIYGRF